MAAHGAALRGRAGEARGRAHNSCHCCVCLKIVTNAPSVHFMASAINKMLQHTQMRGTKRCICVCANNMGVLSTVKGRAKASPGPLPDKQ